MTRLLLIAAVTALVVVGSGIYWSTTAVAEEESKPLNAAMLPATAADVDGIETVPGPTTDPDAASELPHRDLDRSEALKLLRDVFAAELQAPAGPFDELHIEKFLADNVAVIPAGEQPEPIEGEASNSHQGPTLMHSTVPLRAETASGEEEVVELGLEHVDGELRSSNPIVEVGVPQDLGDGIDLTETGVQINLIGAPEELSPSTVENDVAFYPNVSENVDLVIAPTPTGVETLTHIRSADAPLTQTFNLDLPDEAILAPTQEGGAIVTKAGKTLVEVAPPDALDAAGTQVPVELDIEGDLLSLTATPDASTQFPILVDPLFQTYKWEAGKYQTGIHVGNTGEEEWSPQNVGNFYEYPYCSFCPPYVAATKQNGQENAYGLYVTSTWYDAKKGDHGAWIYTVPRYFKDSELPTSFISNFTLTGLTQWAGSPYKDPYLVGGLWDVYQKVWGSSIIYHEGLEGHNLNDANWVYKVPNPNENVNDKMASVGLWATQDTPNGPGNVRVLSATVELAESSDPAKNSPSFSSIAPPSQWMDQTAIPIDFTVQDTGLGVYSLTAGVGQKSWKTLHGCSGVGGSACPRIWSRPYGAQPALKYEPSQLSQGINTLKVVAEDPLGHVATATVPVKIDHTVPSLAISGPLSEVAAVGESWPFYNLDIEASDGTKTAPQSGIVKTAVKVDGKVVNEAAPGCETQSCGSYRRWTLEADEFSEGKHTLEVTATDGVGLSTTKIRSFKLDPEPAPELDLSGSLTEQEALGISRPRYALEVDASTEAGQKYEVPAPIAAFEFGKGLVGEPEDIAVDSAGNVWIPRPSENLVKEFDRRGKYLKQVGAYSATGCGLSGPRDIAIDSADNLWIANGNGRVAKYNPKGECVLVFGGSGKGEASIGNASCVGIAPGGSVWVCDWEANKVSRFTAAGSYLGQFGSKGTAKGQFSSPSDLAFGPGGEAWVSDNKRVQKFSAAGQFLLQIDDNGWGNGEINGPSGLAVDAEGNLFVVETSGNRIQEFNSEGEHRSNFGNYGTSLGQLYWPTGIAIDVAGGLWIADTHNSRIQKWIAPRPPMEPVLSAGGSGSGNGQLSTPSDIAIDAKGNHWVVDTKNNRIQKFGPEGEYLIQFGSAGSGKGQFKEPSGIAIDSAGTLWISDSGNERIVHFAADGKYLGEAEKYKGLTPKTPTGIAIDQVETIWVADAYSGRVVRFGPEGEFLAEWIGSQGSGSGQLKEPHGLAIDREGHLLVADSGNNRIEKLDEAGTYLGEIGDKNSGRGRLSRPLVVSVDSDGNIWASSFESEDAVEFSPQGEYLNRFGWTAGQMGISGADGIAADRDGDVWVTAGGDNQLQVWRTSEASASLSVSVGSKGSGDGQLSSPKGIATDAAGNHWVADSQNARIEKFGPEGEYLGKCGEKGSGAAQLNTPYGVAIDASGNLWVTDAGNGRIKHFSPQGKYLGQAESIANVTPSYPTGIAIDAEGTIWVTDIGKGRVAKFGPEGEYLWEWIGTSGSGKGQLASPFAVAADPEGSIWIADTNNKRLQKFDSTGKFLGEFGKEGSGDGSLSRPIGVAVDSQGTVWATDSSNGRVKAFDSHGKYLARFGPGAGAEPLTEPFGVSVGGDGRVWVADQAGNRIQAWVPAPADGSTSELSTGISVDGDEVFENTASCAASSCAMEPEWLLDASGYEEGEHLVEVTATDAYGRTTTEELEIEVEPDKVKPTIEAGGELFNAPEGWVEQESYGLNASTSDGGYGVTSVALKIDGDEVVSTSKDCPDGGCELELSKTVNMNTYAGGAHAAQIVATDGAGNVTTRTWTVNVDPDGHVSSAEAIETLEAVEQTSDSIAVAPTNEVLEPGQMEGGDNPSLIATGSELESEGVPDTTTMTTDPNDGFTIQSPGEETTITPTVSENASETKVTAKVAGVSANTSNGVDTIVRPVYNGAQTFQAIRSLSSPEEYSWTVKLAKGQKLEAIDSEFAKVIYEDGSLAFLITAEGAHDATGVTVPSSLEVSGNVLTVKVAFKSGQFTLPIIAGQGWETKYEIPTYVELPEDEHEIYLRELEELQHREEEERARAEAEGAVFPEGSEPPPPPAPLTEQQAKWFVSLGPCCGDTAAPPYPTNSASANVERTFQIYRSQCTPSCAKAKAQVYNASFIRGPNWAHWEQGTEVHAKVDQALRWKALIWPTTWNCGTVGPWKVTKGSGEHLIAYAKFTIESWFLKKGAPTATPTETNFALQDWIYPNGFQEKHVKGFDGQPQQQVCPRVAGT